MSTYSGCSTYAAYGVCFLKGNIIGSGVLLQIVLNLLFDLLLCFFNLQSKILFEEGALLWPLIQDSGEDQLPEVVGIQNTIIFIAQEAGCCADFLKDVFETHNQILRPVGDAHTVFDFGNIDFVMTL